MSQVYHNIIKFLEYLAQLTQLKKLSDQLYQQKIYKYKMLRAIFLSLLLVVLQSAAFKPCEPFGRRIFYGDVIKSPESSQTFVVYFNTVEACSSSYLQLVKKSGLLKVQCSTTELSLSNNTDFYKTHVHRCSTGSVEFQELFHYNVFGWDGSSSSTISYKDYVSVTLANPLDKKRDFKWVVVADWGKIELNSYKYTVIDDMLLKFKAQEKTDALLLLGDLGYDLDTNNCYNYQRFVVELADTAADIPIISITGNHEYNTPDNWELYVKSFELYGLDTDKIAGFSLGSAYMAAFDPYDYLYITPEKDEVYSKFNQLLDDAKDKGQFIIATSHYPLACSGGSKFCTKDRQVMKAYWQAMLDHNVSFYIGAHWHVYQRLYPYAKKDKFIIQEGNYRSDQGYLISIIEGVGGNDKDMVDSLDKIQDFTASYTVGETGFGIMDVTSSSITYRHFSTKTGETDKMTLDIIGQQPSMKYLTTS